VSPKAGTITALSAVSKFEASPSTPTILVTSCTVIKTAICLEAQMFARTALIWSSIPALAVRDRFAAWKRKDKVLKTISVIYLIFQ
jgi:hypothetical protein